MAARRLWTVALVLLCAGSLWLQFHHIASTLPYPQDIDEGYVSGPANRTIVTGTLHPYIFIYPSLPKYLAAVGMSVGFLRSARHLEVRDVHAIGSVGYPYYETPRVMQGARQLFAILSVIALAATGFAAWHLFQRPAAIFLAPFVLWTSPLFFYHSWVYLNVDIVGTCFTTLALAACVRGTRCSSIWQSAVIPGLYAGLAAGSKYTMAVVVLSILVAIGLSVAASRRFPAWLAAIAAMVAGFLIAVPYSLIDVPGFVNGLAQEAFHYANGHRGAEAAPGLPQLLFYARGLITEFGWTGTAAAVLGMCLFFVSDWRRTAVLMAFPVALMWLLASQRVHFERNVLSLHPIVALFVAYGLIRAHGWSLGLMAQRGWRSGDRRVNAAIAVLLMLTVIPLRHVRDQFRDRTDSRNLAQAWIAARVPSQWTIIVPRQLRFDTRALTTARGEHVREVDLQAAQDANAYRALIDGVQGPGIILTPRWIADSRFPGEESARALNENGRGVKVVKTFGTNPVLVNYTEPVPSGDPAFGIGLLGGGQLP